MKLLHLKLRQIWLEKKLQPTLGSFRMMCTAVGVTHPGTASGFADLLAY